MELINSNLLNHHDSMNPNIMDFPKTLFLLFQNRDVLKRHRLVFTVIGRKQANIALETRLQLIKIRVYKSH
jgi:hypothetical protein